MSETITIPLKEFERLQRHSKQFLEISKMIGGEQTRIEGFAAPHTSPREKMEQMFVQHLDSGKRISKKEIINNQKAS